MADKITKEVLVALEYQDSIEKGIQLSPWAQKWIELHGIPNPRKAFQEQQKLIEKRNDVGANKWMSEHNRIRSALELHGINSPELAREILAAHQNGTPYRLLETWTKKPYKWIKVRAEENPEFAKFQQMCRKCDDLASPTMIKFYQHEIKEGVSIEDICLWTGFCRSMVESLIDGNKPMYEANITYYFEVPAHVPRSEQILMLNGTIKPRKKIDKKLARKRVRALLNDRSMENANFIIVAECRYARRDGIEINIRPMIKEK